jgi:predicted  nucleic acid-binding Zn-ribbon protein
LKSISVAIMLTCGATALAALTPATAHADGLEFFQTLSANIGCAIGPLEGSAFAGCEIREHIPRQLRAALTPAPEEQVTT